LALFSLDKNNRLIENSFASLRGSDSVFGLFGPSRHPAAGELAVVGRRKRSKETYANQKKRALERLKEEASVERSLLLKG
jgi:hypothetical protein